MSIQKATEKDVETLLHLSKECAEVQAHVAALLLGGEGGARGKASVESLVRSLSYVVAMASEVFDAAYFSTTEMAVRLAMQDKLRSLSRNTTF